MMMSPVDISSAAIQSNLISQIILAEGAHCAVHYTDWSPTTELQDQFE